MSLLLDLGHLALIIGLIYLMIRRATFNLPKLNYLRAYQKETELRPSAKESRVEDWVFVSVLLVIEFSGFLQEASGLIVDKPAWAAWSPVGLAVANLLTSAGMTVDSAATIRGTTWWMHGILAWHSPPPSPGTKPSTSLHPSAHFWSGYPGQLALLPSEPKDVEKAGISSIEDFTWKDMLHLDACTKCGRCHEACPARTAGYPLSPRDFILDLRTYNDEAQGHASPLVSLVGGVIAPETLWACRSCGACQEICPVGIEHPSLIVRMRRHLVEQGDVR